MFHQQDSESQKTAGVFFMLYKSMHKVQGLMFHQQDSESLKINSRGIFYATLTYLIGSKKQYLQVQYHYNLILCTSDVAITTIMFPQGHQFKHLACDFDDYTHTGYVPSELHEYNDTNLKVHLW